MAEQASASEIHWRSWYSSHGASGVSWYQEHPVLSLRLIAETAIPTNAAIVDIGGGASTLVDDLLAAGFTDVTVLDIADSGLEAARLRLGPAVTRVNWIVADLRTWRPDRQFDLWHDRAVLHFMIDPSDRAAYAETVRAVLRPGGYVVLSAFALDGPERCSGLPVRRYDTAMMAELLGPAFALTASAEETHRTPGGVAQHFTYAVFRRP